MFSLPYSAGWLCRSTQWCWKVHVRIYPYFTKVLQNQTLYVLNHFLFLDVFLYCLNPGVLCTITRLASNRSIISLDCFQLTKVKNNVFPTFKLNIVSFQSKENAKWETPFHVDRPDLSNVYGYTFCGGGSFSLNETYLGVNCHSPVGIFANISFHRWDILIWRNIFHPKLEIGQLLINIQNGKESWKYLKFQIAITNERICLSLRYIALLICKIVCNKANSYEVARY